MIVTLDRFSMILECCFFFTFIVFLDCFWGSWKHLLIGFGKAGSLL